MQKCLVVYGNKPLLSIWLDRLSSFGVGPFLINTHYMSHQVENYVSSSDHRAQITLSNEEEILGTAGTLISNIDFFKGGDGMLIHADNYCVSDFTEFMMAHKNRPKGCLMTMMTFKTDMPSSCGIVKVNKAGVVTEFYEKSRINHGNLANGAIYILSRDFMEIIKTDFKKAIDFSTEIIPNFFDKIYTYENKIYHRDIGTVESYNLSIEYHNSIFK
jgi:mannose-1-phosphate guanylyltransferase